MDGRYGLLGEGADSDLYLQIHELLGNPGYGLIEPQGALEEFLSAREFDGLNVAMPYTRDVLPFLDKIDKMAQNTGVVNTIVNDEGRLIGYNTDYEGFLYLMRRSGIDVRSKVALILGSGGTARTVAAAMRNLGARRIITASRSAAPGSMTYEQAQKNKDVQLIINTTPVGMYPDNDGCPIDLRLFPKLCGVLDAVFNPISTNLVLSAKAMGVVSQGGLAMLVAQAARSHGLFYGEKRSDKCDDKKIAQVLREVKVSRCNLVLVGMPSCGKSGFGRRLAKLMGRELIDTDKLIQAEQKTTVEQIFKQQGEVRFRELEKDALLRSAMQSGIVISTGGGAVLDPQNVSRLRQNGVVCFIDRPINQLKVGGGRPLSDSRLAIRKMHKERFRLYAGACDFAVRNAGSFYRVALEIKDRFYEYAGDKRTKR